MLRTASVALRNWNCRRQRCSLTFDSAQVSSVPTSFRRAPSVTGTRRSPPLPKRITARKRRVKPRIAGRIEHIVCGCQRNDVARVIFRAAQRTIQAKRDRCVCKLQLRLGSLISWPSSVPRGMRQTARRADDSLSCSPRK